MLGEAAAKTGVTVERTLLELGRIAYSDIGRALKWGMAESREEGKPDIQYVTLKESGELDEDTRRAISAAFADRRRAQIANAA